MKESDLLPKNEAEKIIESDLRGHNPIRYENGQFICPERGRVVPEFPVGPEA